MLRLILCVPKLCVESCANSVTIDTHFMYVGHWEVGLLNLSPIFDVMGSGIFKVLFKILMQVAFSGIPPRAFNHLKPWLPVAQQIYCLQQINDVALTVNKTLKKLATMIANLHYIRHPKFEYDIQKLEDSKDHCLWPGMAFI